MFVVTWAVFRKPHENTMYALPKHAKSNTRSNLFDSHFVGVLICSWCPYAFRRTPSRTHPVTRAPSADGPHALGVREHHLRPVGAGLEPQARMSRAKRFLLLEPPGISIIIGVLFGWFAYKIGWAIPGLDGVYAPFTRAIYFSKRPPMSMTLK